MQYCRYDENGNILPSNSDTQGYKMIPCVVEPDQSLSIREIYSRWRKGQSTSLHPYGGDYDDDADDIDFERENPIDICQVENDVTNLRSAVDAEKEEIKEKKKAEKLRKAEQTSFAKELAKEISEVQKVTQ